jgi:hypothetical protein
MNNRIGREAAILIVLFGLIMLANPNMWWLMFVIGPMVMNATRNRETDEQRQERERQREERRIEDIRRNEGNWSNQRRRSVADELRRQRTAGRAGQPTARYGTPTQPQRRSLSEPEAAAAPLSHAAEAVAAAGHEPDELALLPVDIGFLAYSTGSKPVVHREAPIPDTVDYIQPYIELYLERAAAGTLRFEIVDSEGEIHYAREERRQLKAGRTPVIPETRMPVGDFLYTDDAWSLRVYAANTLIAEHHFGWIDPETAGTALREHLAEDGELSADLEVLVEDARLQPMSLDELLGGEEEPPARSAGRRG